MAHTPFLTMLQRAAAEIAADEDAERRDEPACRWVRRGDDFLREQQRPARRLLRGESGKRLQRRQPRAHESSSSAVGWPA